jgi:hypothetical protein
MQKVGTVQVVQVVFAIAVVVESGCSRPAAAPPVGLVKPSRQAFDSALAEKFTLKKVVISVVIPKGNPTKDQLLNTDADAKLLAHLPSMKGAIECEIEPDSIRDRDFHFGVRIDAPYRGHERIVHATGGGRLKRMENGSFAAEIAWHQSMPLDVNDKAVFSLRVTCNSKELGRPVEVDIQNGELKLIKEE